jgi:phosphatidylglycerol lysyltransferase
MGQPASTTLELLAARLEPFYGFRSLLAFKQKFRPRWEPVYLIFPGMTSLPRISLAILRAYLPGLGPGEVRALLAEALHAAPRPGRARPAPAAAPEPPQ